MKILFLTPQLPYPPRQGTAMRNWGLLYGVAQDHEVWLLSFDDHPNEIHKTLSATCAQVAAFGVPQRSTSQRLRQLATSSLPDMAWRLWSPEFAARLVEWVSRENFNVIQIEGIELARYQSVLPRNARAKIIFDDHNCEYVLQQRAYEKDAHKPKRWHAAAYSFVQWQRLKQFERDVARRSHATLCVSPQDVAALNALDSSLSPHLIPNGIDVEQYASFTEPADAGTRQDTVPTLVFTGKMDFRPNVDAMLWFAQLAWLRIKQAVPEAQWLIVGQKPSPRLDPLRADDSIHITGAVEDTRDYIARADVYIAPLQVGGGTRFKLLEAMSMRKAIVSTILGCEGFEVNNGVEMMLADDADQFAGAVIALLRDSQKRSDMGENALRFAWRYDWREIVPKLEKIYSK